MRLDNIDQIEAIAERANFSIFELPSSYNLANILTKHPHLQPDEKDTITIDAVKEFSQLARGKQTTELILVIEHAESMNEAASNAFLKNLEEPGDHIHFVFLCHNASKILQTIKSRAQNYYIKVDENPIDSLNDEDKAKAKQYISATAANIAKVIEPIVKDKKEPRQKALKLVENSILLCNQSYLMTGNKQFLTLLTKLDKTYDALKANGNIRLQLIANMV